MRMGIVLMVIAGWALACGGGSACARLNCAACDSPGAQGACNGIVRSRNERACEVALDQPNFASCR